jgi:hypothetical protein
MEASLSQERWQQIAIAMFDNYVAKNLTETSWIVTNEGIDKRDLSRFATTLGFDPVKLRSTIVASLIRTDRNENLSVHDVHEDGEKEEIPFLNISEDEETEIIIAVLKFNIKESNLSLFNLKRKFGKMPHDLNHRNTDLKVTLEDLADFIKPLYKVVIDETFTF